MTDLPSTKRRLVDKRSGARLPWALRLVFSNGQICDRRFSVGQAIAVLGRATGDIPIDDDLVSRQQARFTLAGDGTLSVQDLGSVNGTHINGEPAADKTLRADDVIKVGGSLLVVEQGEPALADSFGPEFLGSSPALAKAVGELDRFAPTELSLLILGETGTGKELAATRVHRLSGRRGAFVPTNCGAVPRELVESFFFGHVKGAFTGASGSQDGAFVGAQDGTLFLDEIGEMPADAQAKLLRVLESKTLYPVGSFQPKNVNARVISATNANLESAAKTGKFREDLYTRLAGHKIVLPALGERRGDILLLMTRLLEQAGASDVVGLDVDLAQSLLLYAWPGNVRELRQLCQKLAIDLRHFGSLSASMLPETILRVEQPKQSSGAGALDDKERLVELMTRYAGNVARVARALGKQRMQIYRLLKEHDLDPLSFRAEEAGVDDVKGTS